MFLNGFGITIGRATRRALWMVLLLAVTCCASAHARTLTFDEVPSGTVLRYSFYTDVYRVRFDDQFLSTDHIGSEWGPPRSEHNVLVWSGDLRYGLGIVIFGYSAPTYRERDPVTRVGMYVSTQSDVAIQITAYNDTPFAPPLATVFVGGAGQSWTNQYVEITAPETPFSELHFEGVNSPNDLLGFCIDDMTITYVPEPSSILALCAGIGAMGAVIRRRRG